MPKHPVKMDGKSLSPQKELAQLLRRQFPQIFAWRKPSLSGEGIKGVEGLLTKDGFWKKNSSYICCRNRKQY
jgi:hypothetical protein